MNSYPKDKDMKPNNSQVTSPASKSSNPVLVFAAAGGLVLVAIAVLGLMLGSVTVDGGSAMTSSSKLSLVILLVQACVAAFGILATYIVRQSLWIQLGNAAESEQGVPLRALDMSTGPLGMLSTWSTSTAGAVGAVLRSALALVFTTWLGTAIIPRVGQVHWYDVPNSPVTTIADIATSLQTGNCYTPADPSGLNLGSCSGNWQVGTVAALTLGNLFVMGTTYSSGCSPSYTGCAQAVVAGLSPQQDIHNFYPFCTTSGMLPTYQVNLQCNLNQKDLYGGQVGLPQNESIWIASVSNSSFDLNMLGLDALGIPRSVSTQCTVSLPAGSVTWTQDASNVAVADANGVLGGQADPSILVSQFASLVTWANKTGIGYSWAPLFGVMMSSHDDGDVAPLAQVLNGLLAGLLNRAYVDSVLHSTADEPISVTRPRIHFATGVARWLCVGGAALVLVCAAFLGVDAYRGARRIKVAAINRPSALILTRKVRAGNGSDKTDALIIKWRESADDDSARIVIEAKGEQVENRKQKDCEE